MAEGTIGGSLVIGQRMPSAWGLARLFVRSPASIRGTVLVRSTAPDALSNLVAVLELTADGQMRCSAATRRPLTATVRLVQDALVAGDYYDAPTSRLLTTTGAHHGRGHHDGAGPIAAFAWPMLLQAGGLARLAGTGLELTPRGETVLATPSYQALGELWEPVAQERIPR